MLTPLQFPDPGQRYNASWAEHMEPPPVVPLDEWCDGRLVLPREMSPEPGVLRLDRTPYLVEPLRAFSDPDVDEVAIQCGTQLAKSTALLVAMAQVIADQPAPLMLVQPTIDLAKRFSRQRVAALIRANHCLSEKISDRSRDGGNTMLLKEFPGGILVISGANSAASLASMPAKVVLGDEIDDWPEDVDGQGDPIALTIARQDSFGRRARRMYVSSPKRPKGVAGIESRRLAGTNEHYEVPCPNCGEFQQLEWGADKPYGLKWHSKDGRPLLATVAYACRHCAGLISESSKTEMLARGRWVQKNPGPRSRTFHLSSLYSPLGWLSWTEMVAQWVRAQIEKRRGNTDPLKAFINTRLAETWEETGTTLEASKLKEKAEAFPLRFVPRQALVLLAAVDVQDDRFEVDVWAIGPLAAMWTVDTIVLVANPALAESWEMLDQALLQHYEHEDGYDLAIDATAVDTGGHYTHEAYNFVRTRAPERNIHAIKGADKPGMPLVAKASMVDVNSRGALIKGGVKLWTIGVHAAKDRLFGLMRAEKQLVHFSHELDSDYYDQITAEHRVPMKTARGNRFVWVKRKGHARNERLDCAVYVVWLAERLKLSTWTPRMWDALRTRLEAQAKRRAEKPPSDPNSTPSKPATPAASASSESSHIDDTPKNWF